MEYRKFKADYLFTGNNLYSDGQVLITDKKGKVINIVAESEAGEGIQAFKGIITPGLINAHCHLELSHLKNKIPEKTGLVEFVFKVVTERHYSEDEIHVAIAIAETSMLNCGIVAVGDICNNNLSLTQKKKAGLSYYNFIEISGWNPNVAEQRFQKCLDYYDEFILNDQKVSIVPHAPYSVSEKLWGKIAPTFAQSVVSIHNQETKAEDEFFLKGKGDLVNMYKMMNIDNSFYQFPHLRSIQTYFTKFAKASSVILVHNTFTKQEDVDYINQNKSQGQLVSFCLCPNANLYIENKLPDVKMLSKSECNIVIGTDSLASNHQLSILEELKTISKSFGEFPIETLLQWATINGAKALQMDNQLGSFETGKTPGVVLIDNLSDKNITPLSTAKRLL